MPLQIYLPFNGSISNCGLIKNSELTVTTTPTYVDGKLGKAMSTGGIKMSAKATSQVLNNKALTIAFWIYPNVDDGGTGGVIFGKEGMTAPNNRKFTIFQYPNANDLHWSWQNDTSSTFTSGVKSDCLPSYTWTHVCFTYQGGTTRLYINGEQVATSSGISASETFAFETQIVHNNAYRYINDFRIYDNCLTPKEVKLLSQGLCLHYPCNDSLCTSSKNLYSGDNFEGKASTSQYTITKLSDERGYNYKLSYTGTGSNAWRSLSFPAITHTPGKTYLFSCKVRKHAAPGYLQFRAARISNDYGTSMVSTLSTVNDEEWHEYQIAMEMPETFDRSGTTYTVSPRIEFYSINMATSGTVYTYDFDLKDIMIAECDSIGLPTIDGALASNIVYDCSGLGNNGSVTSATMPAVANTSPRYGTSYYFDTKHYLTGKCPWGARAVDELTISAWVKQDSGGGYSTWFSCNGYGNKGLWLGVNAEKRAQWAYMGSNSPYYVKSSQTSIATGTWHLFTYTFDNGIAHWYLDGELSATTEYTAYDYTTLATTFTLGDSYSGSSWNTSFLGNISDLRIYATSLSADEIKDLYRVSASLLDSGTFLLGGELIE